ncbi:YceI family protein [Gynuella sunshinyii]|uniref:YceI family protein n=1 Tax=Gynuella sunshinyii TaxID=1445505 RepID=UPI0014700330|nr:YceI family protein [Gynuella sunshinyii]
MNLINKLCLATGLLISTTTFAAESWTLDKELSTISFQSTKNGAVVENHTLKPSNGSISATGEVTVNIALDSVQTGIDIRNERLREILFQTTTFPLASIQQTVNLSDYPEGTVTIKTMDAQLSLHGMEKTISLKLAVLKTGKTIQVSSVEPVLLNAADFGLDGGINQLKDIAKLNSIAQMVPVSVTLVFEQ